MGQLLVRYRPFLYRVAVAFFVGIFLATAWHYSPGMAFSAPRLANYYLRWDLNEDQVKELAKWDLVILDMETQVSSPDQIRELRRLNPQIKILVYITAQEIRKDALQSPSQLRRALFKKIPEQYYLTNLQGEHLSSWPGTELLNLADNAPLVNGQQFNSLLAHFVTENLLATGLWDGVFYDNAWEGVTWFTGANVDLDRDGVPDQSIDEHWQNGMKFLYNETRRLSNDKYLLVGNGGTRVYRNELNGLMMETFPNTGGWQGTMNLYKFYEDGARTPQVIIINRNTRNTGKRDDYRSMRFGFGSALLGNGYYSFDYGDQDHSQAWWYDEYGVKLGEPAGSPESMNHRPLFAEDVWRRDYNRGVVLVNATDHSQMVDLGGEFEKIIGTQDKTVNDGSIVDTVELASHDGLVMLKTFKTLSNVWLTNGSFIRFYNANGARARNGFFAFEDGLPGGARVYHGDLDGDGITEKIVATGAKFEIFNSRGEHWFNDYPFGGDFKGEIQVAVGKLRPGKEMQIVVAPSSGGKVIVYDYHGGIVRDNIYPLGKKYRGGFSVAIGRDAKASPVVAITTAASRGSEVILYDATLNKVQRRFFPFGAQFHGSLSIAIGDFNGDGSEELAVVGANARAPVVNVFSQRAKRLSRFALKGFLGGQKISLGAEDVNFEGKKEIVVMSAN